MQPEKEDKMVVSEQKTVLVASSTTTFMQVEVVNNSNSVRRSLHSTKVAIKINKAQTNKTALSFSVIQIAIETFDLTTSEVESRETRNKKLYATSRRSLQISCLGHDSEY